MYPPPRSAYLLRWAHCHYSRLPRHGSEGHSARSFVAVATSLVLALLALLPRATAQGSPSGNTAHVRRDPQGVPHITADNEVAAWYALGYEQARDGLLFLQYACKAAKGELTWVRGDPAGLLNDLAVKILGSHLGSLSTGQLQTLLAPKNPPNSPPITANFYDNCVAFAAGANSYRELVKNAAADPPDRETKLRTWLATTHFPGPPPSHSPLGTLAWVFNDPIDPVDIASHGALTSASWTFLRPWLSLVNSNGIGYTDDEDAVGGPSPTPSGHRVDPALIGDPLDPSSALHQLEQMRQYASGLCGMASSMSGSNSFGWSHLFCKDPHTEVSYAGLVADPHQGLPFTSHNFIADFRRAPNHLWFAHIQVTPPGASQPTYDVFGHVPYGSATYMSCHNRSLAMGGRAASPNWNDHFLLRLEANPSSGYPVGNGTPGNPYRFYSYYRDSAPGTNNTWEDITEHTIHIKRPLDNAMVPITYWRAGSFGFILPSDTQIVERMATWGTPNPSPLDFPVVYGERVYPTQPPPRWRVDTRTRPSPPKMRYWAEPQKDDSNLPSTSPMVVTLRTPMDPYVAGNPLSATENRHWQLARDFWELSHATSVSDPRLRENTNGAGFPVSVCFADNAGRTLTTLLSAIPKRGADDSIANAGYSAIDKYAFYNHAAGPVPARHFDDRMFDWKFHSLTPAHRPAPLLYLEFPDTAQPMQGPFKAFTWQDPAPGSPAAFPPSAWSGTGPHFRIDGGFFASASNDNVWGYSRRMNFAQWSDDAPTGPYSYNNLLTDNWLLKKVLDFGVGYQTTGIAFEAPVNQQIVVDQFTQIAERYASQGSAGQPPLTPDEMRAFVVSPKLYNSPTYTPPAGVVSNPALPAPIRLLKEVVDNPSHPQSPLVRASEEILFFKDLWAKLHDTNSQWRTHAVAGQTGLTVDLQDLWIQGHQQHGGVFWYADPDNPTAVGSLQWFATPPGFPLIDFVWSESDLGCDLTAGIAANSTNVSVLTSDETTKLNTLVRILVDWGGVATADRYKNLPDSTAACLLEMARMGYRAEVDYGRKWLRLVDGGVLFAGSTTPVPLAGGQVPGGPGTPTSESTKWTTLEGLAFPMFQHTSLFQGGLEPPYEAIYFPNTKQPRTTLGPHQINQLVKFFLQLGGHYIDPEQNNGIPSRKLARWELLLKDPNIFVVSQPGSYPLTAGMERLTAVRRWLATDQFMHAQFGSHIPQFLDVFTARAYGHDATPNSGPLWPTGSQNAAYVEQGLRSVVWHADVTSGSGFVNRRGFQRKFLGMGGSYATMLAMFPSHGSAQVQSFFWCTPGIEAMGDDPARFNTHMNDHASNILEPSYYSNFQNFAQIVHLYIP